MALWAYGRVDRGRWILRRVAYGLVVGSLKPHSVWSETGLWGVGAFWMCKKCWERYVDAEEMDGVMYYDRERRVLYLCAKRKRFIVYWV